MTLSVIVPENLVVYLGTRGLAGAIIGGLQWLVLRSARSRASWWIAWSVAAAVCGGIVSFYLSLMVGLLVSTAVEGAGMVWLLRQPAIQRGQPPMQPDMEPRPL
ncbi:MAG: hypothetical protein IT324_11060 [Anaerolineae bacterium]|nr:hypothetical protein [Anaerolineae bacterium]